MNSWQGMKPIRAVDYLIIHCADTSEDQNFSVLDIDRWHKERGWAGVGYHFVIRRDGVIEKGRPETIPGAHARGVNHLSLGICLIGGKDANGDPSDDFTQAQWDALRSLVDELLVRYPRLRDDSGNARVIGHRDLPGVSKTCPSFEVADWFAREFDA